MGLELLHHWAAMLDTLVMVYRRDLHWLCLKPCRGLHWLRLKPAVPNSWTTRTKVVPSEASLPSGCVLPDVRCGTIELRLSVRPCHLRCILACRRNSSWHWMLLLVTGGCELAYE